MIALPLLYIVGNPSLCELQPRWNGCAKPGGDGPELMLRPQSPAATKTSLIPLPSSVPQVHLEVTHLATQPTEDEEAFLSPTRTAPSVPEMLIPARPAPLPPGMASSGGAGSWPLTPYRSAIPAPTGEVVAAARVAAETVLVAQVARSAVAAKAPDAKFLTQPGLTYIELPPIPRQPEAAHAPPRGPEEAPIQEAPTEEAALPPMWKVSLTWVQFKRESDSTSTESITLSSPDPAPE